MAGRSEEHTSELQSRFDLVCRLLLEKKKKLQLSQRIDPQLLSIGQKFIKRAQSGELQTNIRPCLAAFHDREQVIAKIVGVALLPRFWVVRAKCGEGLTICFQRSRRGVSLNREVTKELLGKRVPGSRSGHDGHDQIRISNFLI